MVQKILLLNCRIRQCPILIRQLPDKSGGCLIKQAVPDFNLILKVEVIKYTPCETASLRAEPSPLQKGYEEEQSQGYDRRTPCPFTNLSSNKNV